MSRKTGAAFEQSLRHRCRSMFSGAGLQPRSTHCLPDKPAHRYDPQFPHVCADPATPGTPRATFSPHNAAEHQLSSHLAGKMQEITGRVPCPYRHRRKRNPNCCGLEAAVKKPSGNKTFAQSLSCSKSSLLRFLRLGLHPGID